MDYCEQGHPPVPKGTDCGPCADERLAMPDSPIGDLMRFDAAVSGAGQ